MCQEETFHAINIDRSEPGIPSQRDASAVEATQRGRSRAPPVSAGHVKKPDLLRMRLVEHMERLAGVGCNNTLQRFFAK